MNKNKINIKDIKFEYFNRASSKGGMKQNKTNNAVRATHIPTGIVAEEHKQRSQTQNKKNVINNLQAKLDDLAEEVLSKQNAEAYEAKPETSFGSQVRTYKLCGNRQEVIDHRTGIRETNIRAVLDGELDNFIKGNLSGNK